MAGLVHIYCGDGKGKTTAALGLCIRAIGCGKRVMLVQFLKSQPTSELAVLNRIPEIQVIRSDEPMGFTFQMNPQEKTHARSIQQDLFSKAQTAIDTEIDLLVLDEIMAACSSGMVSEEQVLKLIRNKPSELEIVLTGRNPPVIFVECADYVSEIQKIKHPFDKGIAAREGIEM